ncbi:MAG: PIN domain-containing protein [Bryobacteraceae bacterium]
MNIVLDASAMIAFLRDEAGAEAVMDQMRQPERNMFAHALNLCEVYYDFAGASEEAIADEAINDLFALGITERNDMHAGFWRAMGRLKSSYKRVSLADCAALALAANSDAVLLTADRHELEPMRAAGICKIDFIR